MVAAYTALRASACRMWDWRDGVSSPARRDRRAPEL